MFLKAPRAKITINMQKRFWGKKFPKGLALGFLVKIFKSWISLKLSTLGFFDLLNMNLQSDFALTAVELYIDGLDSTERLRDDYI